MKNVYSVIFKHGGKEYYFVSAKDILNNVNVIVETEKGLQFGKVVNKCVDNNMVLEEMKDILRLATEDDYNQHLSNLKDSTKALKKASSIANEKKLKMNFIDASYTFDRTQLLLSFVADERVDFRELAKSLASIYRTRIELRQIGARDKAKEIGGIGQCGRELCCKGFLNHIDSISMNMAKNQNLSLNPNKINGQCGRLLCCLTYEDEEYRRCQKNMPQVGQMILTKSGKGKVVSTDVLQQKYKVAVNDEIIEVIVNE